MLLPVTLPVTVLRALVHERFGVSELLTSLFMSINMVGAVLAAAPAGALADRFGRRRDWIVAALLADAALLFALTLPVSFPVFLFLRFLEGCAHIVALSLLLSLAAAASSEARRGRVMGLVGAGITLGVAIGAPLGGVIGRSDPLLPLQVGSAVVAAAALLARFGLVEVGARRGAAFARDHPAHAARQPAARRAARLLLRGPLHGGILHHDLLAVSVARARASRPAHRDPDRHLHAPVRAALLSVRPARGATLARGDDGGGSFVYGVGTLTLGFWPVDALPGLMGFLGIASAVMFVPSLVLATEAAPREIRGSVLGAFNAAGSLGFIAGPLAGGFVSQSVAARASWEAGYQAAFAVAGVSEILCVLVTLPFLLRLVRLGRTR